MDRRLIRINIAKICLNPHWRWGWRQRSVSSTRFGDAPDRTRLVLTEAMFISSHAAQERSKLALSGAELIEDGVCGETVISSSVYKAPPVQRAARGERMNAQSEGAGKLRLLSNKLPGRPMSVFYFNKEIRRNWKNQHWEPKGRWGIKTQLATEGR